MFLLMVSGRAFELRAKYESTESEGLVCESYGSCSECDTDGCTKCMDGWKKIGVWHEGETQIGCYRATTKALCGESGISDCGQCEYVSEDDKVEFKCTEMSSGTVTGIIVVSVLMVVVVAAIGVFCLVIKKDPEANTDVAAQAEEKEEA